MLEENSGQELGEAPGPNSIGDNGNTQSRNKKVIILQ
jgi:hypothetical protein